MFDIGRNWNIRFIKYINELKSKLPKKYRNSQYDIPPKDDWALEEYSTTIALYFFSVVFFIIGFLMVVFSKDNGFMGGMFFIVPGFVLLGIGAYFAVAKDNELDGYSKLWSQIHAVKNEASRLREPESEQEGKQVEKKSRRITQNVRDKVWRRDEGKCTQCGSNENLEFDHIIPVSKGGANTYRNIQLLCEVCNREKSDNIG